MFNCMYVVTVLSNLNVDVEEVTKFSRNNFLTHPMSVRYVVSYWYHL